MVDPDTRIRRSPSLTCQTEEQVADFFERIQAAVACGIDAGSRSATTCPRSTGREMRGIDGTSTADPHRAGLSKDDCSETAVR